MQLFLQFLLGTMLGAELVFQMAGMEGFIFNGYKEILISIQ